MNIGLIGYKFNCETSWEDLIGRDNIDAIDITAAREGGHIFCAKSLTVNLKDVRGMLAAVNGANVKHKLDLAIAINLPFSWLIS